MAATGDFTAAHEKVRIIGIGLRLQTDIMQAYTLYVQMWSVNQSGEPG